MRFLDKIKWLSENKGECIAFVDEVHKELTFGELDELSGRVYSYLSSKNIGREDFVFICLPRGYTPLVASIGVLKAGAAFVITEDDYPKERIDFIKNDCGSKLTIDKNVWEEILSCSTKSGYNEVDKHSVAFAVYTSGTTGTPKGVLHEYGNIDRIIDSYGTLVHERIGTSEKSLACISPLNFIAIQMFGFSLTYGGHAIHIIPYTISKNPLFLKKYLCDNKIYVAILTASLLRILDIKTPHLKDVFTGSEPVTNVPINGYMLHNIYSMSEAGFIVCGYSTTQQEKIIPVGKPWFDLDIKLIGEDGRESDEGEVTFPNPYVRGYINRHEENKKSFRNGWFYTGDLAKRLPDGNYMVIGRMDDMIKINGNRVEPAEIENAAKSVLKLNWAAVKFVTKDDKTLVCLYYTDDITIDDEAARKAMAEFLPYYMLPSHFIHIDNIPVSANGKLNRKLLPDPVFAENTNEYAAPTNKIEQQLCDSFAKVLGFERVGINDDFFGLGGDSISTIKIIGECGLIGLDAKDIFEGRTVKKIAEKYNNKNEDASHNEILYEKRDFYPISENQRGLYIEWEMDKESQKYNLPRVCFFENTSAKKLQGAVQSVIDMHPALKTKITIKDGETVQAFGKDTQIETEILEIDKEPDVNFFKQFIKPFDLLKDNLCRFKIIVSPVGTYLFFDIYHIIFDGLSSNILLGDINKILKGETVAEEEYTSFDRAVYENEWTKTEEYSEAENYFHKLTDGAGVAIYPHSSKPDSEKQGLSVLKVNLDECGIKAFCRENGFTQSSFFMTAFAELLHRLTREEKIIFASLNNGRSAKMQNTIGMFVKTIPVVSHNNDKNMLFTDAVQKTQQQFAESSSRDIYPYHKTVSNIGSQPEIMFVYQGGIDSFNNNSKNMILPVCDAIMPISVLVYPNGKGQYTIEVEYDTHLYCEKDIEILANAFKNFAINSAIAKQMLCAVSMVSDEEKESLLTLSTGDVLEYDKNETFVDMFLKQVQIRPDSIALVDDYGSLTYGELDEQSNRVAAYLIKNGVKPNSFACIMLPRKKEFIVCMLGVMKSGAAYVPVDMDYPEDRRQYMIDDSGAKIIIIEELLEEIFKTPKAKERINLSKPDGRAYMIYTSGSTGKPKGVVIKHSGLRAFIEWNIASFEITASTHNAVHTSFSFDASLQDLVCPISVGGRVSIISEVMRRDIDEIYRFINKNKITNMAITTQLGMTLLNNYDDIPLSFLMMGGEKLLPYKQTSVRAINIYGPTEFTVCSSYHIVNQKKDIDIPIGRPVPNSYSFVCDNARKLVPQGTVGELCLAGVQIAEGYWNLPEKTKEVFVDCPYLPNEKMYRTGDLCRYNEDGNLEFIGRIDHQIKLRGFRIELGEIESVAAKYNGIKAAVAIVIGTRLCLYYTAKAEIDKADLKSFLSKSLTEYMVPTTLMQIDELPVTPNGKIDKKALPEPECNTDNIKVPKNKMQQEIFDIVAEIIGHRNFGVDTDIYYAGLNSIGAIKLNAALSKAFDAVVKTKDLKQNNTVEQLESYLKENKEAEVYARQMDYPLTQTQTGIFVECMSHPDSVMYNIPVLLRIDDCIDLKRLESAVYTAVSAHPAVKARLFMNSNGDIRIRRIDEAEGFAVELLSVDDINDVKNTLVKPFELFKESLIRVKLICAESRYLFLEMHHIISDGVSIGIFLRDISEAYLGNTPKREIFTGFEQALEEEKLREGSYYQEAKDYYEKLFADCDTECLPVSVAKLDVQSSTGSVTYYSEQVTTEEVKGFCTKYHLSINAFFTAAFGMLISKYCGKNEAVFASIYHGRNDSRLENTVSMLVKTFPVLCHLSQGDMPIVQFVKTIEQQLIDSAAYDIYSFADIKQSLGISADIMFAYQGDSFDFDSLCGKSASSVLINLDVPKAALNLNVLLKNNRICCLFEYDKGRFDEGLINDMLKSYEMLIAELLRKNLVRDVSVLAISQKEELDSFQNTSMPVEQVTLPVLFERQVEKTPSKSAVISGGVTLSFAELNERANRVAHSLLKEGVAPDMIVGLMLNRSVDAYAVREGILKSGGAFLSLEPDYPNERIRYILEDSKASILVTTYEIFKKRRELMDIIGIKVLILEELYTCENTSNPQTDVTPENLAYCIYTSGSTGKPKGVLIEQRNVVNMLNYCQQNILAKDYVDNTSVFLGLAALTFDVSVIEEMMPMYHGQTVALATEDEIHNPILLAEMMLRNGVDMMKCTPSYMLSMLDVPQIQKALCRLNAIIIGAEAFPPALYQKMRAVGMTAKIFNSYGPTETCVTVTIDELDGETVTIGKPAGNVKVYMLDQYGHILPKYARGELVIVGKCVGRGYVGMESLTKEKFITIDGAKAYSSGDIAYWNGMGKISFCGRADNQVKLRGLRVELDEIENAISTYPGIGRSVVLLKENESGQFLCGYFTARNPIDTNELNKQLEKSLVSYMIPKVYMQLESFPQNQNGKLDRKGLPEPSFVQKKTASGNKPKTKLQKQLADAFERAIGVTDIDIHDDFFEMGGTSLSASKVLIHCMNMGLPVVYADLFRYTTVAMLEKYIQEQLDKPVAEAGDIEKPKTENDEDLVSKDSKAVKDVLGYNIVANLDKLKSESFDNVLLTGVTGFLGTHMLKELIDQGYSHIICLVRSGKGLSAESRVKLTLMYYFGSTYEELIGNRVQIVDGDITDEALAEKLALYKFDVVINCAACVKHFVNDDLLMRVNVEGVKKLIEICKVRDKKLIQISTVSVAGEITENMFNKNLVLHENEHDFGQLLDNEYIKTKYCAETAILEAIADGMNGKIIRVGNLMSRAKDGEFQMNFTTNGFMSRLRAISTIGKFPVELMDTKAELSPIDYTAKAILLLSSTNRNFTVFHAYSCHHVHMANIIGAMNDCGISVDVVNSEEYEKAFLEILSDDNRNMKASAMLNYNSHDNAKSIVGSDNTLTTKALYRLGFSWPLPDDNYFRQLINALTTLGFFQN